MKIQRLRKIVLVMVIGFYSAKAYGMEAGVHFMEWPLNKPIDALESQYAIQRLPEINGGFLPGMNSYGSKAEVFNECAYENGGEAIEEPAGDNSIREAVLMQAVMGEDGRKRVLTTTEYPYSCFAKLRLFYEFDGKDIQEKDRFKTYIGSGFMIGHSHMLTAAHCVYACPHKRCNRADCADLRWIKNLVSYCGFDAKGKPLTAISAIRIYVPHEYIRTKNTDFDFALVVFDKPVGLKTGWLGCLYSDDLNGLTGELINVSGYPADKDQGENLYTMGHHVMTPSKELIKYIIDTFGGQSGSPVWMRYRIAQKYSPYAIAVHTTGASDHNYGTRFTASKLGEILKWVNLNGSISVTLDKRENALQRPGDASLFGEEGAVQIFQHAHASYKTACSKGDPEDKAHARRRLGELAYLGYIDNVSNLDAAIGQFQLVGDMADDANAEDRAWAHYWLGKIYLQKGESNTARQHFEKAASEESCIEAQEEALLSLAQMDFKEGNLEKALRMFSEIVNNKLFSKQAQITALFGLGKAYFGSALDKNFELAHTCLQRVVLETSDRTEKTESIKLLKVIYDSWVN